MGASRRVGLLVLGGCLLLYLPLCGSYGLWDPWEGHYAEVARQMRLRGDWISLWWPGAPTDRPEFWSKPVLTFWIEALAFRLFGLAGPGAPPGQLALSRWTEWACRVPMALLAALGVWGVFYASARLLSRRAGLLAAVACATMPMYCFVARQALTDMPFVGPMTAALCLGAVALNDQDAEVGRHHPLRYCVGVLFALIVVPQLVYDSIALRLAVPLGTRRLVLPGVVAMAPYLALGAWFLRRLARAQRKSQLQFQLAVLLCGLAGLAKGLVGVGLPGLVLLLYLALTRDFRSLRRLDWWSGLLALVVVTFPWYHAMLIRHGVPFWSELFGDNHWRRLVIGRHGDNNGGFEYYVRELGFGLLPWAALAAVAVPAAVARARPDTPRGRFLLFASLWVLVAYAVVSVSMTKFHHYVLPALPAIAILCGWFLDALLRRQIAPLPATLALCLFGVPMLGLLTWQLTQTPQSAQRLLWLFDYDYIFSGRSGRAWPAHLDYTRWIVGIALAAGVATALAARRWAALVLAAAGLLFASFAVDKMLIELSPHWSQKHLLASYYRERAPGDRLVAWEMYWRGETFYSENELYDPRLPPEEKTVFIKDADAAGLRAWLRRHPGTRVFFLIDRGRLEPLRALVPGLTVVDDSNNKFFLAAARL
ncbi:MAG TPA: glycosyltransferase family 39 protein [Polyangia bacterium]|nr:glycosyltransferase family 39 protein [Polyangia bacterium]